MPQSHKLSDQVPESAARKLLSGVSPGKVWLESLLGAADVTSYLLEVSDEETGHPMGCELVIVAVGSRKACELLMQAVDAVSTDAAPQA